MTAPPGPLRLLVVEDDAGLADVVCERLKTRGHTAVSASTMADGLTALGQEVFDVAVLDLILPDGGGMEILRRISEDGLGTEAIVLTGNDGLDTAIEAMKLGAYDYIASPARMDELELLVQKAGEKSRLRRHNAAHRIGLGQKERDSGFVSDDPGMKELMATVARVAVSDLPILIEGESGTGKEELARAIHAASARAPHPFMAVDAAAMAEALLERALFGHGSPGAGARKAGLFEIADRGVLFLDEVAEVSPAVQASLLRAIEAREIVGTGGSPRRVDVRIVSGTSKGLKAEVQAGRFREDLYNRLSGATLGVPPLRERRSDIPLLARHFLARFNARKQLTPRALETLAAYPWPGNVRELQLVIHRAALLAIAGTIDAEDLPPDVRDQGWKTAAVRPDRSLAEIERDYIETVLRRNEGHRGKTARALGIDPKTLYNKLGPERPRKKA